MIFLFLNKDYLIYLSPVYSTHQIKGLFLDIFEDKL